MSLFFLPFLFIKDIANDQYIDVNHFSKYFYDALQSQLSSENLFYFFLNFITLGILNIYMMYVIKCKDSILFIIMNCVRVPLQLALGSIHFIAQDNYEKFNVSFVFSFILLIVGMYTYNTKNVIKNEHLLNDINEYKSFSSDNDNKNILYHNL
jgi:hypothetical protein